MSVYRFINHPWRRPRCCSMSWVSPGSFNNLETSCLNALYWQKRSQNVLFRWGPASGEGMHFIASISAQIIVTSSPWTWSSALKRLIRWWDCVLHPSLTCATFGVYSWGQDYYVGEGAVEVFLISLTSVPSFTVVLDLTSLVSKRFFCLDAFYSLFHDIRYAFC